MLEKAFWFLQPHEDICEVPMRNLPLVQTEFAGASILDFSLSRTVNEILLFTRTS
jgi:hypothetical protein